jgi:hypothetical protein
MSNRMVVTSERCEGRVLSDEMHTSVHSSYRVQAGTGGKLGSAQSLNRTPVRETAPGRPAPIPAKCRKPR